MAKADDEREMYDLVCKEKFDHIIKKQDEVLDLLRGKNSTPGLVEEVRGLKKVHRVIIGAITFILSVIVIQLIIWIRERFG